MGTKKGQAFKPDYTKEEIAFIKANVETMFYSDIGKVLNRTKSSVKSVVRRLKLNTPSIKGRVRKGVPNHPNLSGKRSGKLVAAKYLRVVKNKAIWLCECDCGNTKEVTGYLITNKHVKSCGCLYSEKQYESIENAAYRGHVGNAKSRKIQNFLTKEEYLNIARKPCIYCNDFSIRKNEYTGATLPLNSVDRINNEKFYTVDTVQPVCFICQNMKHITTHENFLKHINKIKINICRP